MITRTALGALVLTVAGLTAAPVQALAAPAPHAPHAAVDRHHACTHTSSGSCIRGGEFCPQASYGHSGWDARGRRYVCKGDHTHPHWMLP
ncbi:MAG: hypothetical protein ACXVW0_06935 [Nocardioides sp.]